MGTNSPEGWVALCRGDVTFIKPRCWLPDARYPDEDCSPQVYASPRLIELETLGPLTTFYPGTEVVHQEVWTISGEGVDLADGNALRQLLPG